VFLPRYLDRELQPPYVEDHPVRSGLDLPEHGFQQLALLLDGRWATALRMVFSALM
jgi:hypothetical protein